MRDTATGRLPAAGFRTLMEALKYCVLLHDARTYEILWANRAACELLGWTVDELKPLKAPDMSKNARQYSRELGHRWLGHAARHGISATEWCYRSRSGEEILTEAIAIRVALPARTVVMVQFRDIAEEKAVRRDLSRTESRLRAFLSGLAEGIVVLDDADRVVFASESAARLLGGDLHGADFAGYCHDGPVPDREGRYRFAAPGDEPRWYAATCQYIEIESDLHGRMLLFYDITDRVRAEEEHRRDTQRLNHLARNNAMGDMAMAIAHEVSQPLAAAYNFVEGARGRLGDGDEAVAWGLDNAVRQIERARRILGSLRGYVGRLEQSEQRTDLNAIVRDCAYFIELRAREHAVAVEYDLTGEPLPVLCENVLIGQVVMNLAFNAVDEMADWPEAEREVRVTTRRGGDGSAVLEVRDRGNGPPPGDRLFDGVFTSKENGSGIGLALSHRIITRHGGRMEAGANQPRGAAFRFTLPMAVPGR
ncbi:PAS domain-containing sensor histidine kinase [Streptomyces iranensis]|uniref:histidine kinase n=1 Tax=Streptomyces iranensis TaxID=576784 RepID=A0A060ZD61_9ACTN|nr:ATP-binding protein [Streptomyces iranensis]MBP2066331.1 PAS domain S-box-containing protein [Streptomyces iranensis]CDR02884.1 two-component system sensor kinase [Streptomyces iranensis]